MPRYARVTFRLTALALAVVLAFSLVACTNQPAKQQTGETSSTKQITPAPIKIGTLPTEDALPLWAAQARGLFTKAGLKVEIITFPSAAERDIALNAGSINAEMGDIIAAASLDPAGTDVRIATVMLGATPKQGRFGIVASPKNGPKTLADAAKAGVATSSNTIQEYVLDGLMTEADVATDAIKKIEVKKVPERFALLMANKLPAAALPEPLLTLATRQGAKLIADDAKGENLSQTVLIVAEKFEQTPEGGATIDKLLQVWDQAVQLVNNDPNAWRQALVDKARLPQPLATSYQVQTYPNAQEPTRDEVESVLTWMRAKQLLQKDVTYESLTSR